MNFQIVNEEYTKLYNESVLLDEGDIYVYADPDMYTEDFPKGLALFDSEHNCACLLGMNILVSLKRTLTLSWTIAGRNGYLACHGGQKRFNLGKGKEKSHQCIWIIARVNRQLHCQIIMEKWIQLYYMMMHSSFLIKMLHQFAWNNHTLIRHKIIH